jgi:hypothetical protein
MPRLRLAASLAAQVMAVVSVAFLLHATHRNPSVLLLVLMTIWVAAPFAALVWAIHVSKPRTPLYILALVIAAGALLAYSIDALGPPRAKAATMFVLVPLVSWILGGIAFAAVGVSRR